ncbi:MAG: hypothetical protein U0457_02285 [Candidatus Sericytochromatia bacterium]
MKKNIFILSLFFASTFILNSYAEDTIIKTKNEFKTSYGVSTPQEEGLVGGAPVPPETTEQSSKVFSNKNKLSIGTPLDIKYGLLDNINIDLGVNFFYNKQGSIYSYPNYNSLALNIDYIFYKTNYLNYIVTIENNIHIYDKNNNLNKVNYFILKSGIYIGFEHFFSDKLSFLANAGISNNSEVFGKNFFLEIKPDYNIKAYYYF